MERKEKGELINSMNTEENKSELEEIPLESLLHASAKQVTIVLDQLRHKFEMHFQNKNKISCEKLCRSMIILLERTDIFEDRVAHIIFHYFKFCLDQMINCIDTEEQDIILESITILVSIGMHTDFFKIHGNVAANSQLAKSFFESSQYCKNTEEELANFHGIIPLYFFQIVEHIHNLGFSESLLQRIKVNEDQSRMSTHNFFHLLNFLNSMFDVLRHSVRIAIFKTLFDETLTYYLENLTNEELKNLPKQMLANIYGCLLAIMRKSGAEDDPESRLDAIRRQVALRQMKCPFMQQRIAGLREISSMVEISLGGLIRLPASRKRILSVTDMTVPKKHCTSVVSDAAADGDESSMERASMDNVDPNYIDSPLSDITGSAASQAFDDEEEIANRLATPQTLEKTSFAVSEGIVLSLPDRLTDNISLSPERQASKHLLVEWFQKEKFVELLLSADNIHVELLKRSGEIFQFLAQENALTKESIDLLWETAMGPSIHESLKDCVSKIVSGLALSLSIPLRMALWMRMNNVETDQVTLKYLLLIRSFTIGVMNSNNFENSKSSDFKQWFGIGKLWELIQDDCTLAPCLQRVALQYLIDLCTWPRCFIIRESLLNACMDNVRMSISVPQSLRLFRRIVSSYPISSLPRDNTDGEISVDQIMKMYQTQMVRLCLEDLSVYKMKCAQVACEHEYLKQFVLFNNEEADHHHCNPSDDETTSSEGPDDSADYEVILIDDDTEDNAVSLTENVEGFFLQKNTSMENRDVDLSSNPVNNVKLIGKYGFLKSLITRLTFLQYLLICGDFDIQLDQQDVHKLFTSLITRALTKEERDIGYSWLMQIHCVAKAINDDTCRKALLEWFQEVPIACVSRHGLDFFMYFFRVVNISCGNIIKPVSKQSLLGLPSIQEVLASPTVGSYEPGLVWKGSCVDGPVMKNVFDIVNPQLYGLGMLWALILWVSHPVSRRASKLLCNCYESILSGGQSDPELLLSTVTDPQHLEYVTCTWPQHKVLVGGFVTEALAQLQQASSSLTLASQDANRIILRCIVLFNNLNAAWKKTSGVSHGAMVSQANLKSNILTTHDETVNIRVRNMQGTCFEIRVSCKSTVQALREKVASAMCADPTTFRLISHGKQVEGLDQSSQLDFTEGYQVYVVMNKSSGTTSSPLNSQEAQGKKETESLNTDTPMQTDILHSPTDMLQEPESLKLLTNLVFSNQYTAAVALNTWTLLMDMPTVPHLLEQVKNGTLGHEMQLNQSPYKTLYVLQIVHVILSNDQDATWAGRFVHRGDTGDLLKMWKTLTISPISEHPLEGYGSLLVICILRKLIACRDVADHLRQEIPDLHRHLLDTMKVVAEHQSCQAHTTTNRIGDDIVMQGLLLRQDLHELFKDSKLGSLFSFPSKIDFPESFDQICGWIEFCLLQSPNHQVRRSIAHHFITNLKTNTSLTQVLIDMLALTQGKQYVLISGEFGELINASIESWISEASEESQFRLFEMVLNLIKTHPFHEVEMGPPYSTSRHDQSLCGLFHISMTITNVSKFSRVVSSAIISADIITHIFEECLFKVAEVETQMHPHGPKCVSTYTRQCAFDFLYTVLKAGDQCASRVFELILAQHPQTTLTASPLVNLIDIQKFTGSLVPCYSSENNEELRDREHLWAYDPALLTKKQSGYVGLQNLGCTCYMNSLFQQLFMLPEFRKFIFQVATSQQGEDSSLGATLEKQDSMAETLWRKELVIQISKMFCYLQESATSVYDMNEFCDRSIVLNYMKPVDIFEQQDVDEFFNTLMDQIETSMENTPYAQSVRSMLGGVLCNQVICKEGCSHISERDEKILACQLDVKGKKSIIESLESYVVGEMLEGDNKYVCGECNEKRDAQKRACFLELPNVLILHLKRFEFDLEFLRKIKVNDYCEFPMELNMKSYTREGIQGLGLKEDNYYEYELVGILVHSGTADSGHYYSYIKKRLNDMDSESNWFLFNDSVVSPFDPNLIPHSCFGGVEHDSDIAPLRGANMMFKQFSAYMLIYERKAFIQLREKNLAEQLHQAVPGQLVSRCSYLNKEFISDQYVFDPMYSNFLKKASTKVLDLLKMTGSESVQLYRQSLVSIMCYIFNTLAHFLDKTVFADFVFLLQQLYNLNPGVARPLVLEILEANGAAMLKHFLLKCPNAKTRETFVDFILDKVIDVNEKEADPLYYDVDAAKCSSYRTNTVYAAFMTPDSPAWFTAVNMRPPNTWSENELYRESDGSISGEIISLIGRHAWLQCLGIPCVAPSVSRATRIIGWVLSFLSDACNDSQYSSHFFQFLLRVARHGHHEMKLMTVLGAIPRLVDCLLGAESPAYTMRHLMENWELSYRSASSEQRAVPGYGILVELIEYLVCNSDISSLPWIDVQILLHSNAIARMVGAASDVNHVKNICVHLCKGGRTNSKIVISTLIHAMKSANTEIASNLFQVLITLLCLGDAVSDHRIAFAMDQLCHAIDSNANSPFLAITMANMCIIVFRNQVPAITLWLHHNKQRWASQWICTHDSPSVRRFAGTLFMAMCHSLDNVGLTAEVVFQGRRQAIKFLVNLLGSDSVREYVNEENYALVVQESNKALKQMQSYDKPFQYTNMRMSCALELEQLQLVRAAYIEDCESRKKTPSFDISIDRECEPKQFKLASLFESIIPLLVEYPGVQTLIEIEHVDAILEMLLAIDRYEVECDWNKGALIRLFGCILNTSPERFLKHWVSYRHFQETLNLRMTVRPTEEHTLYNEIFASAYYDLFVKLIDCHDTRHASIWRLESHHHLMWALQHYVFGTIVYPRVSKPLLTLLGSIATVSLEFRMTILNKVFATTLQNFQNMCFELLHCRILILASILGFHNLLESPHVIVDNTFIDSAGLVSGNTIIQTYDDALRSKFLWESQGLDILSRLIIRQTIVAVVERDTQRPTRMCQAFELLRKCVSYVLHRLSMPKAANIAETPRSLDDLWSMRTEILPRLVLYSLEIDQICSEAVCQLINVIVSYSKSDSDFSVSLIVADTYFGYFETSAITSVSNNHLSTLSTSVLDRSIDILYDMFLSLRDSPVSSQERRQCILTIAQTLLYIMCGFLQCEHYLQTLSVKILEVLDTSSSSDFLAMPSLRFLNYCVAHKDTMLPLIMSGEASPGKLFRLLCKMFPKDSIEAQALIEDIKS